MSNTIGPDDIEWIVNDIAELGVKIGDRCFFLYKGESLEYENGQGDNGRPILFRSVGKREFGETVCPEACHQTGTREIPYLKVCAPGIGMEHDPRYDWRPIKGEKIPIDA